MSKYFRGTLCRKRLRSCYLLLSDESILLKSDVAQQIFLNLIEHNLRLRCRLCYMSRYTVYILLTKSFFQDILDC